MDHDRLFAEFLESSWTDSEWTDSEWTESEWTESEPAGDPVAALAESGVHLHRWEEAPEGGAVPVRCEALDDLVIEDLDHPAPVVAAWTYCG